MTVREIIEETFRPTVLALLPMLPMAAMAAVLLLVGPAAFAAPAKATHPDVGETSETCVTCHREVTPEIYHAWFAGAHGLNNVKCFVCHGSLTERFAVEVTTDRCGACHSDQLESMAELVRWSGMEDATCFSCHPPHRLSPHASTSEPTDTREGGAP